MPRYDHNATNLFIRLERTKPGSNHTPLENYCTEALACLLISHSKFRKRFLKECAKRLQTRVPDCEPEILTQVQLQRDKHKNRYSRRARNDRFVQFDISIQFASPTSETWVIEAKVHSPLCTDQVRKYERLVCDRASGQKGHVLLLVPKRATIPLEIEKQPRLYWEDVSTIAKEASSGSGLDLLGLFHCFLRQKKLSPVTLPKLPSTQLKQPIHLVGYMHEFGQLLTEMSREMNKKKVFSASKRAIAKLGRNEDEDRYEYGFYFCRPDGWIGIVFPNGKNPKGLVLWLEFTASGQISKNDLCKASEANNVKHDAIKLMPIEDGAKTFIEIRKTITPAMTADDVESWLRNQLETMRKIVGRRK